MEIEQYHPHGNSFNDKGLDKIPAISDECESNNPPSGCFDCNICLEVVQDPVVTLCGHLYCWPCIYKWIQSQSAFDEFPSELLPQCPVCKSEISEKTVVPLYGRGQTPKSSKGKVSHLGIVVPKRPSLEARSLMSSPSQHFHYYSYPQRSQPQPQPQPGGYASMPMMSHDGTFTTDHTLMSPMDGMFGKMVFQRIFGNPETTLDTAYPNSYHMAGFNSPRARRQMMQAERSLSRVCFFLFCCIMFCLLMF